MTSATAFLSSFRLFLFFLFFGLLLIHDVFKLEFKLHLMFAVHKCVRVGLDPELPLEKTILHNDGVGRLYAVVAERRDIS